MWNGMLQFASLVVLAVIAWHAKESSYSLVRLRAFLDARDIELRRDRRDDARARQTRIASIDNWLRDTRAIWGKLFSTTERLRAVVEEIIEPGRPTFEMSLGPGVRPAPHVADSAAQSAPVLPGLDPALTPELADLACNIAQQDPCTEKCLTNYETAATTCGMVPDDAQRRTCQEGAYATYKDCKGSCQQTSSCRTDCEDKATACEAECRKLPVDDKAGRQKCWSACNNAFAECVKKCKD